MTDEDPASDDGTAEDAAVTPAERALRNAGAFDRRPGGTFAATTTVFDAAVAVVDGEDARYRVSVTAPALGAAVAGDAVADVVETDWYGTFARRVTDLPGGVRRSVAEGPDVSRTDDEVTVAVELSAADPDRAAADAKAVVEFVEGTWVQGAVPGYEYEEPAAGLLSRARRRAEGSEPRG